jgi:membrane associated rhomboid family serine protease
MRARGVPFFGASKKGGQASFLSEIVPPQTSGHLQVIRLLTYVFVHKMPLHQRRFLIFSDSRPYFVESHLAC